MTNRIPLPKQERLLESLSILLQLSNLQRVEITPGGIAVERGVAEGEPIIPPDLESLARGEPQDALDAEFIVARVELKQLPFEPGAHVLHVLLQMWGQIATLGLTPLLFVVSSGDYLDAALGNAPDTNPSSLFGVPVRYLSPDVLETKAVLIGGTSSLVSSATTGVLADLDLAPPEGG